MEENVRQCAAFGAACSVMQYNAVATAIALAGGLYQVRSAAGCIQTSAQSLVFGLNGQTHWGTEGQLMCN